MPLRHLICLVTACLCLGAAQQASAATVSSLYIAETPVTDRGEEARAAGFERALAKVLVRVTGDAGIASNPDSVTVLESAAGLVQQYGYTSAGELRVGFDAAAVRRAVGAAGMQVWGDERPATLIWLAVDAGGGNRLLLGADDENGWRDQLLASAADRGLPIVFPLLDSQDHAALGFADVWGGYEEKIDAASARYGADAVLIGRASRSGSGLFVRWKLRAGAFEDEWRGGLAAGIERTTDAFARRFAVHSGQADAGDITVRVDAVDSLAAYGDVYNYLESLTIVDRVAVDAVSGQEIRFRVALRGDPGQFARALGLGSLLRPLPGDGLNPELRYEYRP